MYIRYLINFSIEKRKELVKELLSFQNTTSEILEFLLLQDFNDYDFSLFKTISNKNIISLMLSKLNVNNLTKILNDKSLSKIHDIVLIEVSKKSNELILTAENLQKIDLLTLTKILNDRKSKEKKLIITCEEFMKLNDDRQRIISEKYISSLS